MPRATRASRRRGCRPSGKSACSAGCAGKRRRAVRTGSAPGPFAASSDLRTATRPSSVRSRRRTSCWLTVSYRGPGYGQAGSDRARVLMLDGPAGAVVFIAGVEEARGRGRVLSLRDESVALGARGGRGDEAGQTARLRPVGAATGLGHELLRLRCLVAEDRGQRRRERVDALVLGIEREDVPQAARRLLGVAGRERGASDRRRGVQPLRGLLGLGQDLFLLLVLGIQPQGLLGSAGRRG